MRFDDLDLDSVLAEYAKLEKEKGLAKKATYSLPNLFNEQGSSEIDISAEISALAGEEREKLYGVIKGDLLDEAHPEGNKKLEGIDAENDLAVIEDLRGLKRRMLELVHKEMKAKAARIAVKVVKLADKLDDAGFSVFANRLDRTAAVLVEAQDPSIEVGRPTVRSEVGALVDNIKDGLNNLFLDINPFLARLSNQDRASAMKAAEMTMDSVSKLEIAMESNNKEAALRALEDSKYALNSLWDWTADIHGRISSSDYQLTLNYLNRGLELLKSQPRPHREPEIAKKDNNIAKTRNHKVMMLKVQKKVNELLNKLRYDPIKYEVPEDGNPADSETYERIREVFGLTAGRDYRNWNQLLNKLEQKGQQMLAKKVEQKKTEVSNSVQTSDNEGGAVGFRPPGAQVEQ